MSAGPIDISQAHVEQRLMRPLARLRRVGRLYAVLDGATEAYLTLMACGAAQMLLDWGLRMSVGQRFVVSVLVATICVRAIRRRIWRPAARELSDAALASAVDRKFPRLNDVIATAVQFVSGASGLREANSPTLVRAVIGEACEAAGGVDFMEALNHKRARQRGVELGGLVLATVIAAAAMPDTASAWLRRNWLFQETPWPQSTYITPIGFDVEGVLRAPRGEELTITALNRGHFPASAELEWRTESGASGAETMTRIKGVDQWRASLGIVNEDIRFTITGGDERTREYVVLMIDRPRVAFASVRVRPPAYTGAGEYLLEQQTVIEMPRGSAVEIEAKFNGPVASARFTGASGEVAECTPSGLDGARVSWDAPVSGKYNFELTDRDGWTNARPAVFTFDVKADKAPRVSLALRGVGGNITPKAEAPLEISCEDEYGLGGASLFVQRNDDPPYEFALEECKAGARRFDASQYFDVSRCDAEAGDRLRMWLEAEDLDPAGPNIGKCNPALLRVITASDFLDELAAREMELRREFESLISAQRGLTEELERLLREASVGRAPAQGVSRRLAGLARRQDADAQRSLSIARRFEDILGEMRVNKVSRAGDERRISQMVIEPLRKLAEEDLPESSSAIDGLREEMDGETVDALPGWQAGILRRMREILANMLEWEGYREAVALLRELREEQAELRDDTINMVENELEAILGLDEIPEADSADEPGP